MLIMVYCGWFGKWWEWFDNGVSSLLCLENYDGIFWGTWFGNLGNPNTSSTHSFFTLWQTCGKHLLPSNIFHGHHNHLLVHNLKAAGKATMDWKPKRDHGTTCHAPGDHCSEGAQEAILHQPCLYLEFRVYLRSFLEDFFCHNGTIIIPSSIYSIIGISR